MCLLGTKSLFLYPCLPASALSLQTIDRFNNLLVTAFVTPGSTRFLLLHDGRHDEGIRQFFVEVYELYVRVRMGKVWGRLGGG